MVKLIAGYCWYFAFEAESDGVVYVTDRGILLGPKSLNLKHPETLHEKFLKSYRNSFLLAQTVEAVKARDHHPFDPDEPRGSNGIDRTDRTDRTMCHDSHDSHDMIPAFTEWH